MCSPYIFAVYIKRNNNTITDHVIHYTRVAYIIILHAHDDISISQYNHCNNIYNYNRSDHVLWGCVWLSRVVGRSYTRTRWRCDNLFFACKHVCYFARPSCVFIDNYNTRVYNYTTILVAALLPTAAGRIDRGCNRCARPRHNAIFGLDIYSILRNGANGG